jgi:hypothetical protein
MLGKGAMVWKIRDWAGGDPAAQVADAQALGLNWIALKVVDGTLERWEGNLPKQNADLLPALVPRLAEAGVTVIAWGWTYGRARRLPFPSIAAREAQVTAEVVARYAGLGMQKVYLVDAEHDYKETFRRPGQVVGLNMAAEATRYMTTLRAADPGLRLYLCAYRYPSVHGDFAWSAFLAHADGHAPQVYFLEDTRPDGGALQLERSRQELTALKPLPFLPIGPTYRHVMQNGNEWRATGEQLTRFFARAKALGCAGVGVWVLEQAIEAQRLALQAFQWEEAAQPGPRVRWEELDAAAKDGLLRRMAQKAGLVDQDGFVVEEPPP